LKVLLVGSSDFTVIGRPILSPHFVRVEGIVIEKTLSQTQMDYWYAPKKKKVGERHHRKYIYPFIIKNNYLNFLVWRDPLTMIRITNIEILGPIPGTNQSNS
jgi:large subunit ribosomal protein L21